MTKTEPRTYVPFRISKGGLALIEELAHKHRVSRSRVIRAAVSVGMARVAEVEKRLKETT